MNEREFSQKVRECRDGLWRVSYAILRNGADCDDALQEALLRAWRQIGSLRDARYFSTWLTRILINEAKRILKKRASAGCELTENVCGNDSANPRLHDAIMALPVNLRSGGRSRRSRVWKRCRRRSCLNRRWSARTNGWKKLCV